MIKCFYPKTGNTKSFAQPDTSSPKPTTLTAGAKYDVVDDVNGWFVIKQSGVLRFVKKDPDELLYDETPAMPTEIHERVAALEGWAQNIGYRTK